MLTVNMTFNLHKIGVYWVYIIFLLYPPQTVFVGGYSVFTLYVCVSIKFCFLNILKNH